MAQEQPIGKNIKDTLSGFGEKISNFAGSANENIQNTVSNVGDSIGAAKDSFNNSMSDFSSKSAVAVSDSGFLESNSIIAKFGFLILVVVGFIFLLQVGMMIIGYFINNPNPVLVPGQISGTTPLPGITQNPSLASSIQILWSNNQPTGLEYTWSVWLQYQPGATGTYQPVFIKGDCSNPTSSLAVVNDKPPTYSINNGPGLYFYNDGNAAHLYLVVDTIDNGVPTQTIDISNIPINKYFHTAIRCENSFIDIYINGSIVLRTKLNNVPRQNFYNVFVCPSPGFNGYLSTLQYYSRALSVIDINSIASGQPDTKMLTNSSVNISNMNYLSSSWYNRFI